MTDTSREAVESRMYQTGEVVWHSSDGESGPDVGISVGLGGGMIYAGEAPGGEQAWSLVFYPKEGDRILFGECKDAEEARAAVEAVSATLRDLLDRTEAAEASVLEWQALHTEDMALCAQMGAEVEAAEAEVERLREALTFYADVSDYVAPYTGGMGKLWIDCGEIARAALQEKPNE